MEGKNGLSLAPTPPTENRFDQAQIPRRKENCRRFRKYFRLDAERRKTRSVLLLAGNDNMVGSCLSLQWYSAQEVKCHKYLQSAKCEATPLFLSFVSDHVPEFIYNELPPKLRKEVDIDMSTPTFVNSWSWSQWLIKTAWKIRRVK